MMAKRPAPSPVNVAIERLAKLASAGTSPLRMERAAYAIVAGWKATEDASDRVERWTVTLLDDVSAGLAAAEEHAGDVDQSDAGAVRQVVSMVGALRATRDALATELGRL